MKVLTSQEMKEIDRKAIEKIGIPGSLLMENAGIQITRAVVEKFPDVKKEKIVVVAGKGNNGGDGFVAARHLFNKRYDVCVLLLGLKKDLKGDADLNGKIADKTGVPVHEVPDIDVWKTRRRKLKEATVCVDAIFGTGLGKPAEGLFAAAIEDINKSAAFKVSVDIPSGLSADTFQVIGPCVKAGLTVALGAPKIAHVFPPAEEFIGEMRIADISIPPYLFEDKRLKLEFVERGDLFPFFKKRKKDTHKGTYGHVFILSGSLGKTGAAVMAGKAALKMGAGLVTVGTPRSCLPIVARSSMELMTEPLPETQENTLSHEALTRILELLEGKDALLLGPGISTHPSTAELVISLLPRVEIPLVLDADALTIAAQKPDILNSLRCPTVLTPHPGEFARLSGLSVKEVIEKKLELVPQFAKRHGVFLVLKGYRTLTAAPEGRVSINSTGNPGMATPGSGDVLGGMIASLIIQEKNFFDAILAAVYVHGLSGDIGAKRVGERPLTAGNIIAHIPSALKTLELEAQRIG